jgi:hypothetical protein
MLKRNHPFWGTPHRKPPILSGWWLTYPSKKYEFVSWDDDIPNMMEKLSIHVPNHQPDQVDHHFSRKSTIFFSPAVHGPTLNPRSLHGSPRFLADEAFNLGAKAVVSQSTSAPKGRQQ